MDGNSTNKNFQQVGKDALFSNIRLKLHRASVRYGDKAVFEFLSSVLLDFNSKACVCIRVPYDEPSNSK